MNAPGRAALPAGQSLAFVLLLGSVAYVASTPSALLALALPDGGLGHLSHLYAKPFVLAAVLAGLFLISRTPREIATLLAVGVCSAFSLIYAALDVVQYGATKGLVQLLKDLAYNKVTASLVIATLMLGIFAVTAQRYGQERVLKATVFLTVAFSCVSIVLSAINRFGWITIGDHGITENNAQVYESVAVLFLVLFPFVKWFDERAVAAIVVVQAAVPMMLGGRGGKLVALYLLGAYVAAQLRSESWRDVVRRIVPRTAVAALVVLLVSLIPGSNLVGIELAERLYTLVSSSLLRHNVHSNTLISSSDDVVSLYSRIGTTLIALKVYLSAPISGIGIWNAYSDIEVANFGVHGLLPLLLAAYGSLGIIPVLALFMFSKPHRHIESALKLHALVMLTMVGLLLNVFPWWLGVMLWTFGSRWRAATSESAALHIDSVLALESPTRNRKLI